MDLSKLIYVDFTGEEHILESYDRKDESAVIVKNIDTNFGRKIVSIHDLEIIGNTSRFSQVLKSNLMMKIPELKTELDTLGVPIESDCSQNEYEPYLIFGVNGVRHYVKETSDSKELFILAGADLDTHYHDVINARVTIETIIETIKGLLSENVIEDYRLKFNKMLEGFTKDGSIPAGSHGFYLALDFISDQLDDISVFDQTNSDYYLERSEYISKAINIVIDRLDEDLLLEMTPVDFNQNSRDHLNEVYTTFNEIISK